MEKHEEKYCAKCNCLADCQCSKVTLSAEAKEMLIEGLHYYKEGQNWVFTALYHQLRGHCCGSNCRHCVYGFKPNK